ncbi:MAG: hypothetical protein QOJ20_6119 [Mycobacterium sp.]|jgi:hypothetical protein|nr:hypothetical protein [Mycobacterium sp.]
MRDQYLPPQVTRVASVKDLTLAVSQGGLVDVCLFINGLNVNGSVGVLDGSTCSAPMS